MLHTSFGNWSILYGLTLAVAFILLYLTMRQLRTFSAWAQRSERPKERVAVFVSLLAILGLAVGGFLRDPINAVITCKEIGKPVASCLLAREK